MGPDVESDRVRPVSRDLLVVLFDGVCNLCNGFVNWTIDRDVDALCRFVALQTPAGRAIVERAGLEADTLSTIVVVRQGRALIRSSAVLEIGSVLHQPWSGLARVTRLVPSPLRDIGYRVIAKHRYQAFGRLDACRVPTPELLGRFLDSENPEAALRIAGFGPTGLS